MAAPYFLTYLEINRDADERAVKRAYARKLKQIDIDQNPNDFQTLREAYEAALRWAQAQASISCVELTIPASVKQWASNENIVINHQTTEEAPESLAEPTLDGASPDAAAPRDPAVPPASEYQPGAIANEVFEEFIAKLRLRYPHVKRDSECNLSNPRLIETGTRNFRDVAQVRANLEYSLNDLRLINIEARDFFEWHLACWLANGWQPGNEALIGVAVHCFNWDKDRQHLHRFGRPGEILDYAVHELSIFKRQGSKQRDYQLQAIRQLRLDGRPRHRDLIKYLPLIEQLIMLFPVLLPLITNTRNVPHWREWSSKIPAWRKWIANLRSDRRAKIMDEESEQPKGWRHHIFVWCLILPLISGFGSALSTIVKRVSHASVSSTPRYPPNPPEASLISYQNTKLNWINKIREKIRSNVIIPKGIPPNAIVIFSVVQQENGEIIEVSLKQSSGFPTYDQAMEKAIYKSSPLPKAPIPEVFSRNLTLKLSPQGKAGE